MPPPRQATAPWQPSASPRREPRVLNRPHTNEVQQPQGDAPRAAGAAHEPVPHPHGEQDPAIPQGQGRPPQGLPGPAANHHRPRGPPRGGPTAAADHQRGGHSRSNNPHSGHSRQHGGTAGSCPPAGSRQQAMHPQMQQWLPPNRLQQANMMRELEESRATMMTRAASILLKSAFSPVEIADTFWRAGGRAGTHVLLAAATAAATALHAPAGHPPHPQHPHPQPQQPPTGH